MKEMEESKEKEIRTIFESLDEEFQNNALDMLRSLEFAQKVLESKEAKMVKKGKKTVRR